MGSAGYTNISCIFRVIKKNSVQIMSHGDNYCMKKVIELLITLRAHCRRVSGKHRGKGKWEAKTSRFIFLTLIMHKKSLLILCFILGEKLFSPCSWSQITRAAALWTWMCPPLPQTDTARCWLRRTLSGLNPAFQGCTWTQRTTKGRQNRISNWKYSQSKSK